MSVQRVGVLGFMALEELYQEANTTGNYGLQDQQLAMKVSLVGFGAFVCLFVFFLCV